MPNLVKASAFCKRVFDGTHATPKPIDNGKPLVLSKNITDGKLDMDNLYCISQADFDSINKRSQVSQWDILFSMIGSIGNTYLESSSEIDYAMKNIGVFSCGDEKKAKYLYYYLRSPTAKKTIENYLVGAVQKFLPLGFLRDFPVPEYDEKHYETISVLEKIDQKIELNNKVNFELETIARNLYNYWFVQFDFPDDSGRPYKTNGGEMIWSEKLKREIPKGWEVQRLENLGEFKNGVNYDKNNQKGVSVKIINVRNISASSLFIDDAELDKIVLSESEIQKYLITDADILFARSGIPGAIRLIGESKDQTVYSGFSIRFQNVSGLSNEYLFFPLRANEVFAKSKSSGSIMPNITQDNLRDVKIVVPDNTTTIEFDKIAKPIFQRIQQANQQSRELARLRDLLLPMLMNGQIKVN